MSRRVTIEDVAKAAGVSTKTVSGILSGQRKGFSESTRRRVASLAKDLGYSPNVYARNLAGARSYLLALVYDNPNDGYILELQRGALSACREKGFHLLIEPVVNVDAPCAVVEQMLDSKSLHGLILAPPLCENEDVLALLRKRGVRYVRISPSYDDPSSPAIRTPDLEAVRRAVHYLVSLGHRRIGFVKGLEKGPGARLRLAGYLQALEEAEIDRDDALILEGDFSFRRAYEGAYGLLQTPGRPTAIFAANDEMAFGVIAAANHLGISIPSQLSVTGFDDIEATRSVWPQVSTVRQPIADMARAAIDLLASDRLLSNRDNREFEAELVIRGTTGWPQET